LLGQLRQPERPMGLPFEVETRFTREVHARAVNLDRLGIKIDYLAPLCDAKRFIYFLFADCFERSSFFVICC
jgi:hypothetical protein